MSLTAHRVIQYIVIITLCTLAGGGYWYWKDQQAKASVTEKSSDTTGLVGYWSFDEGSGTTAEDFSPAGSNTGTLVGGPSWVDGRIGKALQFTSSGNVDVTVADNSALRIGQKITMSAWVKPTSRNTNGSLIIQKRDTVTEQVNYNYGFWLDSTGKILFQFNDGSQRSVLSTSSVPLNVWTLITVAVDESAGTKLTFYQNGVADGTPAYAGTMPSGGTAPLQIGNYGPWSGGVYQFNGSLDEVRIYNRTLSGANVLDLYQKSVGSKVNTTENSELTNGLVGLWSLNGADVSGTTASDRSGNGNNATLNGSPSITQGKVGQALAFYEGGDYVKANGYSTGLTQGSISVWVKFEGNLSESQYHYAMSSHELGGRDDIDLWYDGYSSRFIFTFGADWATEFSVATPAMTSANELHQWHHLVGVWDKDVGTKIYFDGVFQGANGTTSNSLTALRWSIGGYPGAYKSWLGSVDEARAYNRVLTATEIWNLYQAGGGAKLNSPDLQIDALERGLSGYWKLDDGSGTSATDASTNGNTGTLTNGPTWTTGQIGGAVSFDGTDDYIDIPTNTIYDSTVGSYSIWFKVNSFGGYPLVVGRHDTYQALNGTTLMIDVISGNKLSFHVKDSSGYVLAIAGTTSLTTGQWYHAVATYSRSSGGVSKLYLNGSLEATGTASAAWAFSNQSTRLGLSQNNFWAPFNGQLDEFRSYNRILSAEEIAKLYKSTAPDNPDTGLKGYWSFNGPDVSGTTASDRSGQSNHGTLTNGPIVTPGKIGQALSFDGSNDYVSAGDVNAVDGASTLTLSGWFKRGASNAYLTVGKSVSGMRTFNINFYNDGRVYVNVGDGGVNAYGYFTSNDTDWHHVVFVFDGNLSGNANRAKAYLDGVQQSLTFNNTIPAATQASSDSFEIGRDVNLGTYSSGSIDEVRLYSRAFTQTEVTNLYNLGR